MLDAPTLAGAYQLTPCEMPSARYSHVCTQPASGVQGRRRLADSDEEEEEEEEYADEDENEAQDVGDEAVARRLQSQLNAGARSRDGGGGGPSRATRHAAKVVQMISATFDHMLCWGASLQKGCL